MGNLSRFTLPDPTVAKIIRNSRKRCYRMAKKKTGLGEDPLSWITDTSKETEEKPKSEPKEVPKFRTSEVNKSRSSELNKAKTSEVPKFRTFDVKLSALLRRDQLEFLDGLTREIMSNRDGANKKERITKNTVLRVFIDALRELDIDKENIPDEEELLRRIKERIKAKV